MSNADSIEPIVPDAWECYHAEGKEAVRIRDVKVILTAPDGIRLVIVKIETTEPGLYGVGCATFTQRPLTVVTAIEEYLKPFVVGRDVNDIEDIFQTAFLSSYWRGGPVLHNALSGIDMALWDIKGKLAGMPVYQLFGGKVRDAAPVYVHASGMDFQEVEDSARAFMEQGFRYIRCQVAVPGSSTYGVGKKAIVGEKRLSPRSETGSVGSRCLCPDRAATCSIIFAALSATRSSCSTISMNEWRRSRRSGLAKDLEQFRLFFLEDPFSPEDNGYFRMLRQQTSIPIAMGELYVNQQEYVPLVSERLIDFMRVHISDIGGLSMARKLAAYCEFFAVRTAWHGPGDASPVAHAANLALDLSCSNFGIQESYLFPERTKAVFPGCPEIRDGR